MRKNGKNEKKWEKMRKKWEKWEHLKLQVTPHNWQLAHAFLLQNKVE